MCAADCGREPFLWNRSIFLIAALLTVPTIVSVLSIRERDIDHNLARGGRPEAERDGHNWSSYGELLKNRALMIFLACAFLFHFANAAMLPELGEMLAKGNARAAAPFMSACIVVTQVVIAGSAAWI